MANKNAFLGVRLDAATFEALDAAARAIQEDAPSLLGMPQGTGFEAQDTASLHMTFLFFGEYLRALPAAELQSLHNGICNQVADVLTHDIAPTLPLQFLGFELFPPEKMNLVVARFQASEPLLAIRSTILDLCRELAISLPSSYFSLIAGEGAWSPHVTLGKIRASKAEVGLASCNGAALQALAPRNPAEPMGLTMLGEIPPRAWCDWHGPLAFRSEEEPPLAPPPELSRDLSGVYGAGASKYDEDTLQQWEQAAKTAAEILNACKKEKHLATREQKLIEAAELFQTAAELRPDFVRAYLGGYHALCRLDRSAQARNLLLQGFENCPEDEALASELQKLEASALVSGYTFEEAPKERVFAVQSLPGPGFRLVPKDLSTRWAGLTWRHHVVGFKGSEERQNSTSIRCFSNFYDEMSFLFELPLALCAPGLKLSAKDRCVKCHFSEKAIMMCKAAVMGDVDTYKQIVAAETPLEAKKLGKHVQDFDDALWEHVVCSVAFEVVHQKFHKIPSLQGVLLETGESLIAEATRADQVWGIGIDKGHPEVLTPSMWKGANILGWALMEVRAELQNDRQID